MTYELVNISINIFNYLIIENQNYYLFK